MELLRFQGVQKVHGHIPVLSDVTFRLVSGQKVGLIGPNGSGKTSVRRLLVGEDVANGGAVVRAPALRIGYVPQNIDYEERQTVLEMVLAEHLRAEQLLREH